MKKTYLTIAFILGCFYVSPVLAALSSKTNYFGLTHLKNETHARLTIMGAATLENITVTGPTSLHGPATVTNSRFQSLQVLGLLNGVNITCEDLVIVGSASLSNASISGSTTITGALTVDGGSFQDLTVIADQITLKDAKIQNLLIKQGDAAHPRPQTLILQGETTIEGDLHFEGNKGLVYIEGEGVSVLGDLTGGKLKSSEEG